MPLPLSVAIVCRNSAATIGAVLDSVRGLAGEVVAVDSGSTDATLDLLAKAGARVTRTEWRGHVATKQMALEACSSPWVLCLDSDEPVQPDLAASIRAFIERDTPGVDGARVNRQVWYAGRPLRHAWQPEWRLRLVRRGKGAWTGLDPHDRLELTSGGRAADLRGVLRHDSFVNIADHLAKQVAHARIGAESLRRAGARGSSARLLISPTGAFLKQLVVKSAWRDGWRGWLAAASTAAGTLMKHAILIELTRLDAERAGPTR